MITHRTGDLHKTHTASRHNLAKLGHINLIFASSKCNLVDFFLLKYALTQAQVIKVFY